MGGSPPSVEPCDSARGRAYPAGTAFVPPSIAWSGAKPLPKKRMRREVPVFRVENTSLVGIQLIKLSEPEKCGSPRGTAV